MKNKSSLEKKAGILKERLDNSETFNIYDVIEILQEKKSTVYWTLSNLASKGYIKRVGKGLYTFIKKENYPNPIISKLAKKIWNSLIETEYNFFITGLDVISIFMQHVPEFYPVILYVDKNSKEKISNILLEKKYSLYYSNKNNINNNRIINKEIDVYLHETTEFNYIKNELAVYEKAFVDLYYEVTRTRYPLPLQELAKIYVNMRRRLNLDTTKMIKIASRKNIHYEIRYIVENKYISNAAVKFADLINKNEL